MPDINKILIGEYLESLKEDTELDAIFPMLLDMMGYEILSKPVASKGQSQYGKDVVAIKEIDGVKTRFYFEIKGGADRNITDNVLNKEDGVIVSLRAAKYTPYIDKTIPGFELFPAKFILVHNGTMRENAKRTFDGFIAKEFNEGEADRWDVAKLAGMFSENLFNEYLLVEEEGTVALFKKTLVLIDVPEYDLNHFYQLVKKLSSKVKPDNDRYVKKFISSLNLISTIIYHYCKETNNLERAKECIDHVVLKSWHWILKNNLESTSYVLRSFNSILRTQLVISHEYFGKTLPIALLKNGLFQEQGGNYEEIAYSLRCSDFLNSLIYSYRLDAHFDNEQNKEQLIQMLAQVINSNPLGMSRPLLDNQGCAYLNVFIYLMENKGVIEIHEFLKSYLISLFENLCIIKNTRKRLPELHSNENALSEFIATKEKPFNYDDSSSTLILLLFELTIMLDAPEIYNQFREFFVNTKVDLQTFYVDVNQDTELLLFEKEIKDDGHVETTIQLPEKFEDFVVKIKAKETPSITYRTNSAGYPHLKFLAHGYYKTPFMPSDWRKFYK